MKPTSLSWPALRQLAWVGRPSLPAADLDAHQLLLAIDASVRARENAWQPLPGAQALPPLAPAETQPVIDATGEDLLRHLLEDNYSWLLADYYEGLAARGYRVPPGWAAAVLADQAQRTAQYHGPDPHLARVLGERGRWLAQLNPAWRELLRLPSEATWATDTPRQREQLVRAYRREAPDQARAFLATHLPQVPAGEQAQLLRELSQHLGPADEELLTQYVQSPDPDVRRVVVPLLARLPGNWLVEQLWQYARNFLALRASAAGQLELRIALPQHWQQAWQRAGIERASYGVEEEPLGWVAQMLALIPPQRWTTHWQLAPEQLLRLAAATPSGPALFNAWSAAASLHGHLAWAIALVEAELGGFPLPGFSDNDRVYSPVQVLPPPAAVALLAQVPPGACLRDQAPAWQRVLLAVAPPWPKPILERVLQLLADSLQEGSNQSFRTVRHLLIWELTGTRTTSYDELVEKRLAEYCNLETEHHQLLEAALRQVQFRRQLTQWLTELPPAK